MIQLRWYQEDLITKAREANRRSRRVCVQAPTGSGKTIMFAWLAWQVSSRGKRVLILCHRRELIAQACEKLELFGIFAGTITAKSERLATEPVVVGSIQTIINRLDQYVGQFDLIVLDECHHAVSPTWRQVLNAFSGVRILGFTATPRRLDGQGLGDVFDELIVGPPVRRLIDEGYLADYVAYGPPRGLPDFSKIKRTAGDYDKAELGEVMRQLVGNTVDHYREMCAGMPAVFFGVNRAHIEFAAERFKAAGFRAFSVDGTMKDGERKKRIDGLATGYTEILVSCDLVSEGLDIPAIQCGILGRPTESLALAMQQMGRTLRPKGDGSKAIILDHAGNIISHGLPCTERTWALSASSKKAQGDRNPVKTCPDCLAMIEANKSTCPQCGHSFSTAKGDMPIPEETNDKLVMYTAKEFGKNGRIHYGTDQIDYALSTCDTFKDIIHIRKVLKCKKGWEYHVARDMGWEPVYNYGRVVSYRALGTREQWLARLAERSRTLPTVRAEKTLAEAERLGYRFGINARRGLVVRPCPPGSVPDDVVSRLDEMISKSGDVILKLIFKRAAAQKGVLL